MKDNSIKTLFPSSFYIGNNKKKQHQTIPVITDTRLKLISRAVATGFLGNNWDINISCQHGRPYVVLFLLWWVYRDQIGKWCGRALLSLGIPIKHDLHLDSKYPLNEYNITALLKIKDNSKKEERITKVLSFPQHRKLERRQKPVSEERVSQLNQCTH